MNNPKVSVVVPVYNTEAYVEQAVRSVMDQTLHEIEIIVINDGSTDGSLPIVERLAQEDPRITIHSQSNKGLSEARNAGIDRAHGEFIYFMDSDDLLETDTLALCFERCEKSQLNFVFFDAESFGDDPALIRRYSYRRAEYFKDDYYRGTELLTAMLNRNCYRASACLSFIRTSFLMRLGLRFYPGILHEDELFTPQLYIAAERVGGIERAFFRRRVRGGSIMSNHFSERNLTGYLTVVEQLQIHLSGCDEEVRRQIRRISGMLLTATLHNGWILPVKIRIQLAATLIRHYSDCVSYKDIGVMLLKSPLKKLLRR